MGAERETPRFELGHLVATPGAVEALEEAGQHAGEFLRRHASGDWGELDADDRGRNDRAARSGEERIFSAYYTTRGVKVWIITEADRSATTLLLPSEY